MVISLCLKDYLRRIRAVYMKNISNHTSKTLYITNALVIAAYMPFPQKFLSKNIIKVYLSEVIVFAFL